MRASAHARPVKIRNKTLFVRHLAQWRQFHLLRNRIQQRAGKPGRAFNLPQSSSSMHSPSKRVQRTNFAECYQFRFLQFRHTTDQIIDPLERVLLPLRDNLVRGCLPQTADVTEPVAQTRNILVTFNRVLDGAAPFRIEGVDRFHSEAMQLRNLPSILYMRSSERLKPIARRRSSASPPVKFAAIIAMRRSCS